MNQGVIFVCYGDKAITQAKLALNAIQKNMPNTETTIICENDPHVTRFIQFPDIDKGARWAKLNLDKLTPFEYTLYMDADTRAMADISAIFKILQDGYDIVIAPSTKQGAECMHHLDDAERRATLNEIGAPLQLQGGVMGFRKSERVKSLFSAWRSEWLRFKGKDQGALLRAFESIPNKPMVWLLSNSFNGGELVKHYFGQARRR